MDDKIMALTECSLVLARYGQNEAWIVLVGNRELQRAKRISSK